MDRRNFDPRHSGELLKHMDKQNEVLKEAHRSMLHELHLLQVEEEMLMHKLHEVTSVDGLPKKNDGNSNAFDNSGTEHSNKKVNEAKEKQ